MEGDHSRSVELDYPFNRYILGDAHVLKENKGFAPWHEYLKVAFEEFVLPMTDELKKLMVSYKILNEGELYCTSLMFNLDDETF